MPRGRRKTGKHRTTPDPHAKRVGTRVRALREEKGFSFDAFVEESGLGRGYVSELERGLVVPSLHTLIKLSTALEVPVADLLPGASLREALFEVTRKLDDDKVEALLKQAKAMRSEK